MRRSIRDSAVFTVTDRIGMQWFYTDDRSVWRFDATGGRNIGGAWRCEGAWSWDDQRSCVVLRSGGASDWYKASDEIQQAYASALARRIVD